MQPYICVNDICLFDKSCQSFMWLTFYDNRFGIYFYGQINTGYIVNRHIHFNIRIIMKNKINGSINYTVIIKHKSLTWKLLSMDTNSHTRKQVKKTIDKNDDE